MKKGFTLIELMVVIVIMGILAAVAVPKIFGNVSKAKLSGVGETLAQFEQAATSFYILNGRLANSTETNTVYDFTMADPDGNNVGLDYDLSTLNQLTITINDVPECASVVTAVAEASGVLTATRTVNSASGENCESKLTKVTSGDITLVE